MLRSQSITLITLSILAAGSAFAAGVDSAKASGITVQNAAKPAAAASATPAAPAEKAVASTTPASSAPAAAATAPAATAPATAAPAKAAAPATAAAGGTPCEEVKAKIGEKLTAKGVKAFTLDAVPQDAEVKDAKVIGSCEGGAKKIVYKKG